MLFFRMRLPCSGLLTVVTRPAPRLSLPRTPAGAQLQLGRMLPLTGGMLSRLWSQLRRSREAQLADFFDVRCAVEKTIQMLRCETCRRQVHRLRPCARGAGAQPGLALNVRKLVSEPAAYYFSLHHSSALIQMISRLPGRHYSAPAPPRQPAEAGAPAGSSARQVLAAQAGVGMPPDWLQ